METINYLIPVAQAHTEEDALSHHIFSDYGFMGMGGGFIGGMLMILFWVLVIAIVAYLAKNLSQNQNIKRDKTPLDALKERYAKGEINKDEFEKIKKDLSQENE